MAPPDGHRAPRIPTLSWDSVVDSTEAPVVEPEALPESSFELLPAETPILFEPLSLEPTSAPPVAPDPAPTPAAAPIQTRAAAPSPIPAPPVAPSSTPTPQPAPPPSTPSPTVTPSSPVPAPLVADADAAPSRDTADDSTVRTTPPAVIVPALGDVTSGPEQIEPALATTVLPEIQEATPVQSTGPLLPSAPAAAPRTVMASSFEFDPASVAQPSTRSPQPRSGHRGVKLVVALIVLGGLVAAGVVFGQPYLFPGEWDDAAAPYAVAVETVRGVDFVEPLLVTAEPTAEFAGRLQAQMAAISPDELAEWRALGLATGPVDDDALAEQITGWQDTVYSTQDGQVYHDLGVAGAELDAELVQAMTAASLDQEFRWSADQAQRTLDAAASTSAEVLAQAREVQADSEFDDEVDAVPSARVGALPPVIGYRMLAPHVFADFVAPRTPNPLRDLGPLGPGPLGGEVPVPAAVPVMVDGDVVVDSPMARDRSFWFLVFDGFLDGPTAFAASEAIVENSLTHAVRGSTNCVYATFSGGGVGQTDTLRSALTGWTGAAPAEFASALTTLPDGSLQMSSCDPGVDFAAPVRAGAASDLIAWRAVELATFEAVTTAGGDDVEFVNAWGLIGASNAPLEVAALPAGTSASDIADAARDRVAALYVSVD